VSRPFCEPLQGLSRREKRPVAAPLNGDNFRRNFGRARKQSPVHHACASGQKTIELVEKTDSLFLRR